MTQKHINLSFVTNYNLFIIVVMLVSSCSHPPKAELEFWETDSNFEAPNDWVEYSFADAFSIQLPKYMSEKAYETVINEEKLKNGNSDFISLEKNTLTNEPLENYGFAETSFYAKNDSTKSIFARVGIKYMKSYIGGFLDQLDRVDMRDSESKTVCDQLIKQQLGSGTLLKIRKQDMSITNKANMFLDICYQRKGNTENEGPVTVHIYLLQHTDEAVQITVSYHDKNKERFKDLFNVVQTLEWKQYKSSKSTYQ